MKGYASIHIDCYPDKHSERIAIQSNKHIPLGLLLSNQKARIALNQIKLLFNQCSHAHTVVGLTGIEQAAGRCPPKITQFYRILLVKLEAIQHSFWLFLHDIAIRFGLVPSIDFIRRLKVCINSICSLASFQHVLRISCDTEDDSVQVQNTEVFVQLDRLLTEGESLLHSDFMFNVKQQIDAIDWQKSISIHLLGPCARQENEKEQNSGRLSSLFQVLCKDISWQIECLRDQLFGQQTHLGAQRFSARGIGSVTHSTLQQNTKTAGFDQMSLDVETSSSNNIMSQNVCIETARGALCHKIFLTQDNAIHSKSVDGLATCDSLLCHDWQIISPTQVNFKKFGSIELLLNELLDASKTSQEMIQTRAETLITLINPCYPTTVKTHKETMSLGVPYA